MTPEQLRAYLEREMLKLLTQSGPIPYTDKGAYKIEKCLFKAVGKLSRNIREGNAFMKRKGKYFRYTKNKYIFFTTQINIDEAKAIYPLAKQ